MREITFELLGFTALLEKIPEKRALLFPARFAFQGHLCGPSPHRGVAVSRSPPRQRALCVPLPSTAEAFAENSVCSGERLSSEGKKTCNLLSRWLTWRCWIAGRSPQSGGDRGSRCWRG